MSLILRLLGQKLPGDSSLSEEDVKAPQHGTQSKDKFKSLP